MSVLAKVGDKLHEEIPYSQMQTRKNEQCDDLPAIRNLTHVLMFLVSIYPRDRP